MPSTAPIAADILVVDDTPENLKLLAGLLKSYGHKVRPVSDSDLALRAAQIAPPDLILLDIHMPGISGYEVCRRLKADKALKEIPVVFISALNEMNDKVKAFQSGGLDYITKPFHAEEVIARVNVHLELRRQKRQLQKSYDQLRKMESLRDSLVHMVVHDMRTPVTVIHGALDLLKEKVDESSEHLAQLAFANVERLSEMVSQLLDVSRLEEGKMPVDMAPCSLESVAKEAIGPLQILYPDCTLELEGPPDLRVMCDSGLIRRVLGNLLGNALKFSPPGGKVRVALTREDGGAKVAVIDNGPGIPAQFHHRVFEKFAQVDGSKKKLGTGLGLAFCKLAVEAHGGRIGVKSEAGHGSTFWFTLPHLC